MLSESSKFIKSIVMFRLFSMFLTFVLLSNNSDGQVTKTTNVIKHALVYYTENGQISLLGKHKSGLPVTLINKITGVTYIAKTVSVRAEMDQMGEKRVFTTINKQPEDSNIENILSTAIIGKAISQIKRLEIAVVNDIQIIKSFDTKIKQGQLLIKLLKENAELTPVNEYWDTLQNILPKVKDVKSSIVQFKIIEYRSPAFEERTGPRFLYLNAKIIPLTGQCSDDLFIYEFDGRVFITTGSSCCECGLNSEETYEVKKDKLLTLFVDYSYST